MGIIREGLQEIDTLAHQAKVKAEADRLSVIADKLGTLGVSRETDNYTGEPQVAMAHYFGEEAFELETVEPYLRLLEDIDEHSAEPYLPVLIVAPTATRGPNGASQEYDTSLLILDPKRIVFRSDISKDDELPRRDGGAVNVTHRLLSIEGSVATTTGSIFHDALEVEPQLGDSLWLHSSVAAEEDGHVEPEEDFISNTIDRLDTLSVARVLVGWQEIEEAFLTTESARFAEDKGILTKRAVAFGNLLRALSLLEEMAEHAPRLAELIKITDGS